LTVEVEKPLPEAALIACFVRSDDGSLGGYLAALEEARERCEGEIAARVER
jgi:hypothetical protein